MGSTQDQSCLKRSLTSSFYSSPLLLIEFGKEKKTLLIHSDLVRKELLTALPNLPFYCETKRKINRSKNASLPHINSGSGKTLIHYLYTGEYKIQNEASIADTVPDLEKLFTCNILNLFAAEMFNLSELQELIILEIKKLSSSLKILKSLKLTNFILNSEDISDTMKETAKSRIWLGVHLNNQLKDALHRKENIFDESNLSDSINKTSLLEETKNEIKRIMFDPIVLVQTELSVQEKGEKYIRKVFGKSTPGNEELIENQLEKEMNQVADKKLMIENKTITPCNVDENIDRKKTHGDIFPNFKNDQHCETQKSDISLSGHIIRFIFMMTLLTVIFQLLVDEE